MEKLNCPICNNKLYKMYEGLVCKNWKCMLGGFKCGSGWVKINNTKDPLFWACKYDFDIEKFENKKKWLQLKSELLYEKGKCEICGEGISGGMQLHIHHILPRSTNPELILDKENLMVLCEKCHKEIHRGDKHHFD